MVDPDQFLDRRRPETKKKKKGVETNVSYSSELKLHPLELSKN